MSAIAFHLSINVSGGPKDLERCDTLRPRQILQAVVTRRRLILSPDAIDDGDDGDITLKYETNTCVKDKVFVSVKYDDSMIYALAEG